jgi:hypothetical protein
MNVRQFLNAFTGHWNNVRILEFIGDFRTIGADPEEDYAEVGNYTAMFEIPDAVKTRKVEYFDVENAEIIIWLEN